MGAVTVAIKRTVYSSAGKIVTADVTFSGTYGAGGDTFTPAQFGCKTVDAIIDGGTAGSATTGYVLSPDLVGNKLRLLSMGAVASSVTPLLETTTAGQTGTVARVIVYGDQPYT